MDAITVTVVKISRADYRPTAFLETEMTGLAPSRSPSELETDGQLQGPPSCFYKESLG